MDWRYQSNVSDIRKRFELFTLGVFLAFSISENELQHRTFCVDLHPYGSELTKLRQDIFRLPIQKMQLKLHVMTAHLKERYPVILVCLNACLLKKYCKRKACDVVFHFLTLRTPGNIDSKEFEPLLNSTDMTLMSPIHVASILHQAFVHVVLIVSMLPAELSDTITSSLWMRYMLILIKFGVDTE